MNKIWKISKTKLNSCQKERWDSSKIWFIIIIAVTTHASTKESDQRKNKNLMLNNSTTSKKSLINSSINLRCKRRWQPLHSLRLTLVAEICFKWSILMKHKDCHNQYFRIIWTLKQISTLFLHRTRESDIKTKLYFTKIQNFSNLTTFDIMNITIIENVPKNIM